MRKQSAPCEQKLWAVLRDRQLNGYKFRRQYSVGKFIADFYCAQCRLIIEVDGESHFDQPGYDAKRTEWLASEGYEVLRFGNLDVHENIVGVLDSILEVCEARCPTPSSESHPSP